MLAHHHACLFTLTSMFPCMLITMTSMFSCLRLIDVDVQFSMLVWDHWRCPCLHTRLWTLSVFISKYVNMDDSMSMLHWHRYFKICCLYLLELTRSEINWKGRCWTVKREHSGMYTNQQYVFVLYCLCFILSLFYIVFVLYCLCFILSLFYIVFVLYDFVLYVSSW